MNKGQDRSFGGRRQELLDGLASIRRFAMSLTGNRADADDLLQSTVERLLTRGLPQEAPVVPYALTICRNLWVDEIRSRRTREVAKSEPTLAGEESTDGERTAIGELSLREAQASIAALPEEQRAVLELVSVEGYSYKEAASILEIPIGTVMSRLARARAALVDRTESGGV
ncbi:MAG TPA: RNA polymerase sigma factor [Woeseiaceae bacterium]|nr:RNA polymerase sigma factor [Woeseiaceae bacterium]